MFGMYEFDHSSFKHFFKVIFCQMYHILVIEITSKRILWRGGRGKAERAKGRAGSETSGESVGK